LLTTSDLWAQIPAATPRVAKTNRDEILRRALHEAIEAQDARAPARVAIATNTEAVDSTAPLVQVPEEVAVDAPAPPTNRPALPSNPPGTNAPATNRLALPSKPAAAPPTPAAPAPTAPGAAPAAIVPGTTAAAQPGVPPVSAAPEDILAPGMINFRAVEIDQV